MNDDGHRNQLGTVFQPTIVANDANFHDDGGVRLLGVVCFVVVVAAVVVVAVVFFFPSRLDFCLFVHWLCCAVSSVTQYLSLSGAVAVWLRSFRLPRSLLRCERATAPARMSGWQRGATLACAGGGSF